MPYVFALGVGRSGTTLLGRLLATTCTPARFVNELCPGIGDRIPNPLFMVEPGDADTAARVRDAMVALRSGETPFDVREAHRLERDDEKADTLIVKDVHSLLAYREIVSELDDWRAVVVTRDALRVLDSYFGGHSSANRRYLVEDYRYLARNLDALATDPVFESALATTSRAVERYLRRPRWRTRELYRQAAITEVTAQFLRAWAAAEDRVVHLRFESLCRDPVSETLRVLDFLGLKYDDRSIAEIQRTTSGGSDSYYATDKDSRRVLAQPYGFLGRRARRRLESFLGRS